MKRTALLLIAPCIALSLLGQQAERRAMIHFAVDDHRLDAQATHDIEAFLSGCVLNDEFNITLLGHTDSDGGNGYNEVLARNRARTVREQLVSSGVPAERITLQSFGERRPLLANTSAEDKQQNRRVEIVFTRAALSGLADLQQRIGSERVTQQVIDPSKDHWIAGQQGSAVRLAAGSLFDADGQPANGPVQVTMTEALALNDMIAEGLSTVANGRMLITGGMLRVDAQDARGRPLQLAADASMLVTLPAAIRQNGMTLFTSNTGADWNDTRRAPMDLSAMKLPPRPQCAWPTYQPPFYKPDLSAKPPKPVEPVRPIEPQPPRRESYRSSVRWYQFMSQSRIEARDAQRYEAAMTIYEQKLAKYEEKMATYHADCRTWPERWSRYKESLAQWQNDTVCAREAFWRTEPPKAEERYKAQLDERRAVCEERERVWRAEYELAMQRHGRTLDSLGLTGARDLGAYVFAASQLGWINCDRFYDVPASQLHDLIVQDNDTTEKQVFLVFTGINSMLRMQKEGTSHYIQRDIPRQEPAVVVAYKVVDGRAFLARQAVARGKPVKLDFVPSSIAEVRATIQGLRNG